MGIQKVKNPTIESILGKDDEKGEMFYKIPPYQREYAWKQENWDTLFSDIDENEKGYFLGSIICIDKKDYYDLVDGQQRLTTISILLNAIYNTLKERKKYFFEDEDKYKIYLDLKNTIVKKTNPTLTLSNQNNNNNDYLYILAQNELLESSSPSFWGIRKIAKAYKYFKNLLTTILEEDGIKGIFNYLDKLLGAVLVKIIVDNENSAFTLFESINNKGTKLTPMDLIKNYMIEQNVKQDLDAETINSQWQHIIKNIEEYKDQVRFLRHYYHILENKIEKYPKATMGNLIKIYTKLIKTAPNKILKDMIKKSEIYSLFVHPEKEKNQKNKYSEKFSDLKILGVAPSYALLLYVFDKYPNEDFTELLNFIENWFIRRSLTDYPATNKLDNLFLDLIKVLQEKKHYSFETIKQFMTQAKYYMDDEEFRKFLIEKPLYDINAGAIRYLLLKLEKSKRTRENDISFIKRKGNNFVWSVEHILPQNPKEKSDWIENFSKEDIKDYLHRLGNLTITQYNSNLSNKDFSKKLIEGDGAYMSKNIKINSYIFDNSLQKWTKEDIKKRGKILADEIIELLK